MVDLGPGSAYAVSADGAVTVGSSFLWDVVHGRRELLTLFSDLGLDLTGWSSITPIAISADGRTVAGNGQRPDGNGWWYAEPWIAFLGDPLPPCPGDINGDDEVDLTDLATLLAHFGAADGATPADGDLDADGDIDLDDLASLLASFGVVCP
jgi:hypothetical protein